MNSYKQIGNCYSNLVQDLSKIDIHNTDDYRKYRDIKDYFTDFKKLRDIEFQFANCVLQKFNNFFEDNSPDSGLYLLPEELQPNITDSHRKKFLIFSKSTIIKSEEIDVEGYDRIGEVYAGPDLEGCLEYAYKFLPDVRKGYILPIPRSIDLTDGPRDYAPEWEHEFYDMFPNCFSVPLESKSISVCEDILKIALKVPSFNQIPINKIHRIRQDYSEIFDKFQKFLTKTSYLFKTETDDRRLLMILESIESEIYLLHKRCEEIKKTHKKLRITSGLVPLVIYFSVKNPEIVNHLNFVFSGLTGAYFVEHFKHIRQLQSQIEDSPLYFLQLLNKSLTD